MIAQRKEQSVNQCTQKLFEIIEKKQSNLAVNIDVTDKRTLLTMAAKLAPYICILKTHIDILADFDPSVIQELKRLQAKHQFLIFEDRKFADIGHISALQYQEGIYRIADWADIITVHAVPGPGILEGLKQIGLPKGNGALLLAEMSSKGTLAKGEYTNEALQMAAQHKDFVMGFIARRRLVSDPGMVHLTPGVKLQEGGDALGQQYLTPEKVIGELGSDVIIVGRGICEAQDPVSEAQKYQEAAWHALQTR
jgi:orotidine 5'-phosphate decarboxylase subfamily 1